MRNIKYILINETHSENCVRRATARRDRNLGYNYIVTSEGIVRNPIDIRQVGAFIPGQTLVANTLNRCSIGILYQGELNPESWNLKQREALFGLLIDLRSQFPDAKIMGVSEINGPEIHPSDAMNTLRLELSNEP